MIKKFSELSSSKEPKENPSTSILPEIDADRPANPNLPSKKGKIQKGMSTKYMMPNPDVEEKPEPFVDVNVVKPSNEDVKFIGKVAKLPKGTKASKGFNFLENVKVSKSSIWYIMVERQDNELQMVKYNHKKGVDLSKFVNELKTYYISKYSKNPKVCKMIENIQVDGNDKYSRIINIPLVDIEGRKLISKITEDLIKLLSK
jgi:hypothetical protein